MGWRGRREERETWKWANQKRREDAKRWDVIGTCESIQRGYHSGPTGCHTAQALLDSRNGHGRAAWGGGGGGGACKHHHIHVLFIMTFSCNKTFV